MTDERLYLPNGKFMPMPENFVRLRWCAVPLAVGLTLLISAAAAAQQRIPFEIPAQPLDSALTEYGLASGVQLFFDADVTKGHRSAAVKGVFAPRAALEMLLSGSGLGARAIDDFGFTVVALATARERGRSDVAAASRQASSYSAVIQGAVRRVLCEDEQTAPGSYRALVQLWISRAGVVDRAELVTSSGARERDAMLRAALLDLAVGTPPGNLPQPVTMLIASDDRNAGYCPNASSGRHDLANGRVP